MRYFIYISYLGTNYHGWQVQENALSIQQILNNSLSKILKEDINTVGAGRTDTGVHALNQVAHFDFNQVLDNNDFLYKINSILPNDISVNKIIKVQDDFHARFDAVERRYIYKINLKKSPFLYGLTYHYKNKINLSVLNKASKIIVSNDNFKSFCKSKSDVKNYICNLTFAKWKKSDDDTVVFEISADRFLRGMVRAIVGTMLILNEGKINLSDFKKIIFKNDRRNAGYSVFPGGLYLKEVLYSNKL